VLLQSCGAQGGLIGHGIFLSLFSGKWVPQQQLNASALANADWEIEQWQPYMLETALAIAQKWR